MSTLREQSRKAFNDENITHDNIRTGSLQRIADACELMAKEKQQLVSDIEYYKRNYESRGKRIEELLKEVKSLKAVKTRYKNKLEKLNTLA